MFAELYRYSDVLGAYKYMLSSTSPEIAGMHLHPKRVITGQHPNADPTQFVLPALYLNDTNHLLSLGAAQAPHYAAKGALADVAASSDSVIEFPRRETAQGPIDTLYLHNATIAFRHPNQEFADIDRADALLIHLAGTVPADQVAFILRLYKAVNLSDNPLGSTSSCEPSESLELVSKLPLNASEVKYINKPVSKLKHTDKHAIQLIEEDLNLQYPEAADKLSTPPPCVPCAGVKVHEFREFPIVIEHVSSVSNDLPPRSLRVPAVAASPQQDNPKARLDKQICTIFGQGALDAHSVWPTPPPMPAPSPAPSSKTATSSIVFLPLPCHSNIIRPCCTIFSESPVNDEVIDLNAELAACTRPYWTVCFDVPDSPDVVPPPLSDLMESDEDDTIDWLSCSIMLDSLLDLISIALSSDASDPPSPTITVFSDLPDAETCLINAMWPIILKLIEGATPTTYEEILELRRDLYSGFDARKVHPKSRDMTSFQTPLGLL
ncbi:hypothetical protein EVJ58_g9725 [Rhodofomes roseus]|uniref:Uncharacterized protein n=1 Tax=Rhodofomes roseus TaxID=34475 RepID=A0A4Y9XWJ6_9APHY|nr:hypothetical protein EVJ58_g9725 [Rhodofomes roseus]